MAFKFVLLCALVACANAGLIPAAPIAAAVPIATKTITKVTDSEYDPHPQYSYSYDVADSLTGDFKSQQESRDGDVVQGSYSLLEADGTRRIVDYAADPLNGFNAIVRKEPAAVAVKAAVAAPIAAPVAVAAPVAKVAAPLAVAAPVAKFAAPIAYSGPSFAAPAYAHQAFAAPAYAYAAPAYGGPIFAGQAFAAPAFGKSYF